MQYLRCRDILQKKFSLIRSGSSGFTRVPLPCCCLVAKSCPTLLWPMAPHLWGFPGKNIGVDYHFLLQDIFPTRGLNVDLLNWQVDSLPMNPLGSLFLSHKILLIATRNLASQKTHCRMVFRTKFQILDRISLDGSVMLPLTN